MYVRCGRCNTVYWIRFAACPFCHSRIRIHLFPYLFPYPHSCLLSAGGGEVVQPPIDDDPDAPSDSDNRRFLVTLVFIGALWLWSTVRSRRSPDPIAQAGKYRPIIKLLDADLSTPAAGSIINFLRATPQFQGGLRQLESSSSRAIRVSSWSMFKMIVNPTPMPWPREWATRQDCRQAIKLGAFCLFSEREHIELLLKDLAPFSNTEARQLARLAVSTRLGGAIGFMGGLTLSALLSPLHPKVTGPMIVPNTLLLFNDLALTISRTDRILLETAQRRRDIGWKHVDSFPKQLPTLLLRKSRNVRWGRVGVFALGIVGAAHVWNKSKKSDKK